MGANRYFTAKKESKLAEKPRSATINRPSTTKGSPTSSAHDRPIENRSGSFDVAREVIYDMFPSKMKSQWIIVDGNNLVFRMNETHPDPIQFNATRSRLIADVASMVGTLADRVTIVFDGTPVQPQQMPKGPLEIRFSPANSSADFVIEELVRESRAPSLLLVATSDRMLRDSVESNGAMSVSATGFLELLEEQKAELRASLNRRSASTPRNVLRDYLP
jgi:predicted RNA-binding protein with PIN domain